MTPKPTEAECREATASRRERVEVHLVDLVVVERDGTAGHLLPQLHQVMLDVLHDGVTALI